MEQHLTLLQQVQAPYMLLSLAARKDVQGDLCL
jgi:hypothetical protein